MSEECPDALYCGCVPVLLVADDDDEDEEGGECGCAVGDDACGLEEGLVGLLGAGVGDEEVAGEDEDLVQAEHYQEDEVVLQVVLTQGVLVFDCLDVTQEDYAGDHQGQGVEQTQGRGQVGGGRIEREPAVAIGGDPDPAAEVDSECDEGDRREADEVDFSASGRPCWLFVGVPDWGC